MTDILYKQEIQADGKTIVFKTDLDAPINLENCYLQCYLEFEKNFLVINHNVTVTAVWNKRIVKRSIFRDQKWIYLSELNTALKKIFVEEAVLFEKDGETIKVTCLNENLTKLSLGGFGCCLGFTDIFDFTKQKSYTAKMICNDNCANFRLETNFSDQYSVCNTQCVNNKIITTPDDHVHGSDTQLQKFKFQILPHGSSHPVAYKGTINLKVKIYEVKSGSKDNHH